MSSFEAVVNSNSDGSAPFSEGELDMLLQHARAAPVVLAEKHLFYLRLSRTFECPTTFPKTGGKVLTLIVLLAQVSSNAQLIMAVVEKSHVTLDKYMDQCLHLFNSSKNITKDPNATAGVVFFADFVLFLALAADGHLAAAALLELFKKSMKPGVFVLAEAFRRVVAGQCVPHLEVSRRLRLACNCIDIVREFTSWKVYEEVGISGETDIAMHLLYAEFKDYIGVLITALVQTTLLADLGQFYTTTVHALPASVEKDQLIRSNLILLENFLTFTDQHAAELRQHIKHSGIVNYFLGPLFSVVLPLPGELRTFTCKVVATLCYSIVYFQQYFCQNQYFLSVLPRVALPPATPGQRDSAKVELVGQLARMVINGYIMDAVPAVLHLWRSGLSDEEQQALANFLANPMRRRQPTDLYSPAYRPLQEMFKVRGVPAFVVSEFEDRYSRSLQQRGRGKGKGRGGRGGKGRGRGRGRGRGGHGRGRGRPGGHRWGRRRRQMNRYAVLRARSPQQERPGSPNSTLAIEERLAMLSSDSSGDSSDEDEEYEEMEIAIQPSSTAPGTTATTATAANTDVSPAGVSLSKWRHGPPPEGVPARYICALSHRLIKSAPVITPQGYVFDQEVITSYLRENNTCPESGEPLYLQDLLVDTDLKKELDAVRFNFINA